MLGALDLIPKRPPPQKKKTEETKKGRNSEALKEMICNFKHRACKSVFNKFLCHFIYSPTD